MLGPSPNHGTQRLPNDDDDDDNDFLAQCQGIDNLPTMENISVTHTVFCLGFFCRARRPAPFRDALPF